MKKLIPHIIHEKFLQDEEHGEFQALTMFMDMSGFTTLTEELMKHDKDGAEVLSSIINEIFTPIIDAVYKNEGFISGFAGDAFTAIFPNTDKPMQILATANEINKFFQKHGLHKTELGNFQVKVKIGLSFGSVGWGIIGSQKYKSYYFRGTAIDGCANSEHKCKTMDIVCDKQSLEILKNGEFAYKEIENGYYKIERINKKNTSKNKESKKANISKAEETEITEAVLSKFLPEKVLKFQRAGELRDSVSVFISFKDISSYDEISSFMASVLIEGNRLGAYIKGMDFGDKGGTILAIFGSPISYENDVERALNFILAIKNKYHDKIRAGVTYGLVFAGIIGSKRRCSYDVLGDTINVSARMMMKAEWGQILITKSIEKRAKNKFNMNAIGKLAIRGKSQSIEAFELLGKKASTGEKFYRGNMVGRDKETKFLNGRIQKIRNNEFAGLTYIYGDAGIGKSRFIYEVTQKYEDDCKICMLQCDSIVKKSLNPIVYFLNDFFEQEESKNEAEKENKFTEIFNSLLDRIEELEKNKLEENEKEENSKDKKITEILEELKRTKSLLKALLGLNTAGTLYESLEPKLRFDNTVIAIKNLFKALSLIQPLIIQLEDIHWLDEDSAAVMQALTQNVDDYAIIIIATSRYEDDGSKPNMQIEGLTPNEIELKELGAESVNEIIKTWLDNDADEKLSAFIAERTQSNPFYVEQFCLYLAENKFITLEDNVYKLSSETGGIPRGINSILVARIDRLPAELKEFVQIASVLGREFDISVLGELLNKLNELINSNETNIKNYFDTKAVANILKSEQIVSLLSSGSKESLWNEFTGFKYIFKHALLVQSAYDMQLKKRLVHIHRIAGDASEELYKEDPPHYIDIAHHYEKANLMEKTKKYLLKAGDYFKDEYRNDEALDTFNKVLQMDIEKKTKIDIISKKAEVLDTVGKWDEAKKLLREGLILAEDLGGLPLANIKIALGAMLHNEGQLDEALECYKAAKKIGKDLNDKKTYAEAVCYIGHIHSYNGEYDDAMNCFEEDKQNSLAIGDKYGYSRALANIGVLYYNLGNYEKAMEHYEETKNIALEIGNKIAYAVTVGNIGTVYAEQNNCEEAIKYYEERKKIFLELGDKWGYAYSVGDIGTVYADKGDYESAMKCHSEHEKLSLEIGDKGGYSTALGNKGTAYLGLGDYENATKCREESKKVCIEMGDIRSQALTAGSIGDIYNDMRNYKKAIENYNEAIKISKEIGINNVTTNSLRKKAEILFEQGELVEAKKLNDESMELAAESPDLLFKAKILSYKINSKLNEEKGPALENLLAMLDENNDDEKQALIYFELWNMTKQEEYRELAKTKYQKLYQNIPHYRYKRFLNRL